VKLRARPRADDGFTLVELLITVTITGLIVSVLCAALLSGIQFGPEMSDRTIAAVDTSFVTDRLSDDVANAGRHAATSVAMQCSASSPSVTLPSLASVSGRTVSWYAELSPVDPTFHRVDLYRKTTTSASDPGTLMLTGFCADGSGEVVASSWVGAHFVLTLDLAPSVALAPQKIVIGADRRTA